MTSGPTREIKNPERFDLSRTRILVVDDSQNSLDLVGQVLLGFGVSSSKFSRTVTEAIEMLAEAPFDLIIADAEMPEQDGLDLARRLRRDEKSRNLTTPIIIASGHTPREKVARARDAGANLIILKPIVPGVLLRHIKWLARTNREFVQSPNYCGPDRRIRKQPLPAGVEERRADSLRLLAQPERAMSQDDINNFFD